jgi:hypothetical protein
MSIIRNAALLSILMYGLSDAAAIPSATSAISPDGYVYSTTQAYEQEITLDSGKVITLFRSVPFTANPTVEVAEKLRPRVGYYNFCGDSSFMNKSSGGSPLWADCQNCQQYFESPSYRSCEDVTQPLASNWVRLCQSYTCTFAVKTKNFCGTRIGDSDASDVIRDGIAKFKWYGLVGAEETMGCDNICETASTDWARFHA